MNKITINKWIREHYKELDPEYNNKINNSVINSTKIKILTSTWYLYILMKRELVNIENYNTSDYSFYIGYDERMVDSPTKDYHELGIPNVSDTDIKAIGLKRYSPTRVKYKIFHNLSDSNMKLFKWLYCNLTNGWKKRYSNLIKKAYLPGILEFEYGNSFKKTILQPQDGYSDIELKEGYHLEEKKLYDLEENKLETIYVHRKDKKGGIKVNVTLKDVPRSKNCLILLWSLIDEDKRYELVDILNEIKYDNYPEEIDDINLGFWGNAEIEIDKFGILNTYMLYPYVSIMNDLYAKFEMCSKALQYDDIKYRYLEAKGKYDELSLEFLKGVDENNSNDCIEMIKNIETSLIIIDYQLGRYNKIDIDDELFKVKDYGEYVVEYEYGKVINFIQLLGAKDLSIKYAFKEIKDIDGQNINLEEIMDIDDRWGEGRVLSVGCIDMVYKCVNKVSTSIGIEFVQDQSLKELLDDKGIRKFRLVVKKGTTPPDLCKEIYVREKSKVRDIELKGKWKWRTEYEDEVIPIKAEAEYWGEDRACFENVRQIINIMVE